MPKFGKRSRTRLAQTHPDIQRLFKEVIKHYDCSVLEGHRNKKKQNEAFKKGTSKLQWPDGNHNELPSLAADVAPYPVSFKETPKNIARFYHFVGYVLATAQRLGIKIRCGADWDGDKDFSDQSFDDLPHFELI